MARSQTLLSHRLGSRAGKRVQLKGPTSDEKPKFLKQRARIQQFQQRWRNIKDDLPPQFSRRHIGMISIGGVIGTGLFLGSADALYHGGPVGALLAYAVIGTVVYCLCISMGEMIAFLPNVGGVVGFADLYVDRALGFALGWTSWYSWTVTFPAEIAAASVVINFWDPEHNIPVALLLGCFLALAIGINCLPSRFYGEMEFWFSSLKVITLVCLLIISIVLDLGAGKAGFIGFKNWSQPFADSYLGMEGHKGRFLGFWTVMMQAFFSFSGSEIAGIAAGEVIDATRNVPRALKNVWIRITFFYLGGIFCAGLLVPQSDSALHRSDGTAYSSPFVIAFQVAGVRILPHIVNAVVLLAAWSAAAADLYISSRFLFFVARCNHAPAFFATLLKYPWRKAEEAESDEEAQTPRSENSDDIPLEILEERREDEQVVKGPALVTQKPFYVLPLASVLFSASFGSLTFLSIRRGSDAQVVFRMFCAATSAGSLLTWTAILFTYLRWYQGVRHSEAKYTRELATNPCATRILDSLARIKQQRHAGQPFCAMYGLLMCVIIILTNGWSVFISYEWHVARFVQGPKPGPIPSFLASYLPIPCFIFLALSYKLIYRTKMVTLDEMCFVPEGVPCITELDLPQKKGWRRVLGWVLLI